MRMRVQRALVLGYLEPDWYMAEVPGLIEEALQVFEPLGDHAGLAAVWELESGRLNQIGHPPEMYEVQQRALEHARAAGDRRSELEKLLWLAATTFWGTTPADEGIRRLEATLDEVRGDRFAEQNVSRVLSGFLAMQGRFDEARALLNQSRAAFEELGLATWLLTDAFFRGPIELWAGNPEEAFRAFRESVEGLEETGERAWSCSLAAFAGEALYVLDRLEEAEEWTNRAEASAGKSDLEAQADIRSVRAKILARRGRLEEAERLAVEAVEISNQTYETDHIGDSLFDLAEVLRIAGRREDAADALRKAVEQWDQKGNLVSAAKGRAVLEELGEEESL
jgi:tetratricopeptide (TPR) repeat protein